MKYSLSGFGCLLLAALLLVCIVVSLYLPALNGPFLLDDIPNLSGLAQAKYQGLFDYVLNTPVRALGRPLAYLTFYFQADAWPGNPASFKLFNIVLHAINGVLVMLLAMALGNFIAPKTSAGKLWCLSVLAGLSWSALAIQASTVLYVVQRMTSLSATFTLLGLIGYVLVRRYSLAASIPGKLWLVMAAGLGYIGVFAKENGILFGWYVILLEWWVIRPAIQRERRIQGAGQIAWFCLLFFAPSLLAFGYVIATSNVFGVLSYREWNWSDRWMTETVLLWDYVGRILLPTPGKLNLLNDDVSPIRNLNLFVLLAGAGWLLCLVLSFARNSALRWVGFAGVWFWVGHALESTFIPLELAFEHRNYLPSLAVVPLAIGVWKLLLGSWRAYGKACAAGIMLLFLVWQILVLTQEIRVWKSQDSFTAAAVLDRPYSVRANQMLAGYLVENGRVLEAAQVIEVLRRMDNANVGLALQLLYLQCFDSRVAVPAESKLLNLLRQGKYTPAAEVIDDIRDFKSQGGCQTLSWPTFRRYVNTLMDNQDYRQFRTSGYRIVAYSYFHEENYGAAMAELDKWPDDKANLSYLMVKVNISAHMGNYPRALNLIDLMRQKYERLLPLKQLEYKELPAYLRDMEEQINLHRDQDTHTHGYE